MEAGNILIHLPRQEVDFSRLVPKIGLVVKCCQIFFRCPALPAKWVLNKDATMAGSGNAKGGNIIVPLNSCLTCLD